MRGVIDHVLHKRVLQPTTGKHTRKKNAEISKIAENNKGRQLPLADSVITAISEMKTYHPWGEMWVTWKFERCPLNMEAFFKMGYS